MNLIDYLYEYIIFEDIHGNVIKAYAMDYDDGSEMDEESRFYNNPFLILENKKVIKNVNYDDYDLLPITDIKTIKIVEKSK